MADEIKGRRGRAAGPGTVLEIGEDGVRFRSYVDGSERFLGPEESMAVQAALGSDIALAFDECTPYHADRDYTARSIERTHRWLDRCLAWHERPGPAARRCSGSSRAACTRTSAAQSAERVSAAPVDGLAIGGTLGRDKEEMRERGRDDRAPPRPPRRRATCSGSASPTTWSRGSRLGIDLFDCAVPTRLARHGMALAPLPDSRFRFDVRRARFADATRRRWSRAARAPTCAAHTRAYVHYLSRAEELTGVRLLALHNLTYLERLVRGAREAIRARALRRLPGADPRGRPARRRWRGRSLACGS